MLDQKFVVVVHEPRDVDGKIVFAKATKLSLTGNSFYPIPNPTIIVFDGNIQAAFTSQAATKTTPPTNTITQRDGFVMNMDGDIEMYRLDCQRLVNAAPNGTVANEIAESFNMELKTFHPQGMREDELLPGNLPNSVMYRMKGTGPHQVQMSPDNGTTILPVDPTKKGEKQIGGLTLLVKMWYRNRQILSHDNYGDWTDWLPFTPTK